MWKAQSQSFWTWLCFHKSHLWDTSVVVLKWCTVSRDQGLPAMLLWKMGMQLSWLPVRFHSISSKVHNCTCFSLPFSKACPLSTDSNPTSIFTKEELACHISVVLSDLANHIEIHIFLHLTCKMSSIYIWLLMIRGITMPSDLPYLSCIAGELNDGL